MKTNNTNDTNKPTGKGAKGNLIYPELSYRIMEVVFEVHNRLGPGYPEEIYQRAVVYELRVRSIPFEEQKVIQVVYKGQNLVN